MKIITAGGILAALFALCASASGDNSPANSLVLPTTKPAGSFGTDPGICG